MIMVCSMSVCLRVYCIDSIQAWLFSISYFFFCLYYLQSIKTTQTHRHAAMFMFTYTFIILSKSLQYIHWQTFQLVCMSFPLESLNGWSLHGAYPRNYKSINFIFENMGPVVLDVYTQFYVHFSSTNSYPLCTQQLKHYQHRS